MCGCTLHTMLMPALSTIQLLPPTSSQAPCHGMCAPASRYTHRVAAACVAGAAAACVAGSSSLSGSWSSSLHGSCSSSWGSWCSSSLPGWWSSRWRGCRAALGHIVLADGALFGVLAQPLGHAVLVEAVLARQVHERLARRVLALADAAHALAITVAPRACQMVSGEDAVRKQHYKSDMTQRHSACGYLWLFPTRSAPCICSCHCHA